MNNWKKMRARNRTAALSRLMDEIADANKRGHGFRTDDPIQMNKLRSLENRGKLLYRKNNLLFDSLEGYWKKPRRKRERWYI